MPLEQRVRQGNTRRGKKYPLNGLAQAKRVGPRSSAWKGEDVGYVGLHEWLVVAFGRPDHCDLCGLEEPPATGSRGKPIKPGRNYFEWSCRSGVYSRKAYNWWQLCIKCHRGYDKYFLNATP